MIRPWLIAMLATASVLSTGVAAKDWLLPKEQQRPYGVVKAELVSQGWKPFKTLRFEDDSYCGIDGKKYCVNFPETLWCQEAGKPSCTMGFFKDAPRRYLIVRGQLAERPSDTMIVDEIATPGKQFVDDNFFRTWQKDYNARQAREPVTLR